MRTAELYSKVTNDIIRQLEAGVIPWARPWSIASKRGIAYVPTNVATGYKYSGINTLLLWSAAAAKGYRSHSWMTLLQARNIGARVKRGEHGCPIIFVKWDEKTDEKTGEPKKVFMARHSTAFNIDQLYNLPQTYQVTEEPPPSERVHDRALELVTNSGIPIRYDGTKAFYRPSDDTVVMPPFSWFESPDEFYGVCFHEIVHGTGHPKRLNRDLSTKFGSQAYAFEELVAEMGSAFLCAESGIPARHRNASYVENWLKVLKEDNHAIFRAASYAGHAAKYITARSTPQKVEAAE